MGLTAISDLRVPLIVIGFSVCALVLPESQVCPVSLVVFEVLPVVLEVLSHLEKDAARRG